MYRTITLRINFKAIMVFVYIPGMGGSGRFFFLLRNRMTAMITATVIPTAATPTASPAPMAGPLLASSSPPVDCTDTVTNLNLVKFIDTERLML